MLTAVGFVLLPLPLTINLFFFFKNNRDHGVCNSIKQLLEQFLMSIRNQTIGKETDSSKISSDQFDRCYSFWMDSLVSLIVGSSDVVSEYPTFKSLFLQDL